MTPLEEVHLPSTCTIIGSAAFAGCPNIHATTLRGEIGSLANIFPDACAAMELVEISPETTGIADGFLSGCATLRTIQIPRAVTTIGAYAFNL